MITLGIETSCDETAAAVVKDGKEILSNVIFSQIPLHSKTGGVVPEVAAREHTVKIVPVIEKALKKARVTMREIDAIAVTAGPGLLSSLLIGVNAAMTLALIHKKPLIPVQHVEGHIYANLLQPIFSVIPALVLHSPAMRGEEGEAGIHKAPITAKDDNYAPHFPIAVLTVSGGHNELLVWKGHGKYKFLGSTLDDAAGEAFDKVGRLLGLPYPGGPNIDATARKGDANAFDLPRPWVTKWNFSFSGLKTAMLRLVQSQKKITPKFIADAAASFQESVCEVLATKLINAAQEFNTKEIHLAGGVSANSRLREFAINLIKKRFPRSSAPCLRFCKNIKLCTDNAAMIAAAGYYKFKASPSHYKTWAPIPVEPNLPIKQW